MRSLWLPSAPTRDKDGVNAVMLIAEAACFYKKMNMTLVDAIEALYKEYGVFGERTVSITLPGKDGGEKMQNIMRTLREVGVEKVGPRGNEHRATICEGAQERRIVPCARTGLGLRASSAPNRRSRSTPVRSAKAMRRPTRCLIPMWKACASSWAWTKARLRACRRRYCV